MRRQKVGPKVVCQHDASLLLSHRGIQMLFSLNGEHVQSPLVWDPVEQQVSGAPEHMIPRQLAADCTCVPVSVENGSSLRDCGVE